MMVGKKETLYDAEHSQAELPGLTAPPLLRWPPQAHSTGERSGLLRLADHRGAAETSHCRQIRLRSATLWMQEAVPATGSGGRRRRSCAWPRECHWLNRAQGQGWGQSYSFEGRWCSVERKLFAQPRTRSRCPRRRPAAASGGKSRISPTLQRRAASSRSQRFVFSIIPHRQYHHLLTASSSNPSYTNSYPSTTATLRARVYARHYVFDATYKTRA